MASDRRERLHGGAFDGETMVIDCKHCGGKTICVRDKSRYDSGISCRSCLAAAGVKILEGSDSIHDAVAARYRVVCSVCGGKGVIVVRR